MHFILKGLEVKEVTNDRRSDATDPAAFVENLIIPPRRDGNAST